MNWRAVAAEVGAISPAAVKLASSIALMTLPDYGSSVTLETISVTAPSHAPSCLSSVARSTLYACPSRPSKKRGESASSADVAWPGR